MDLFRDKNKLYTHKDLDCLLKTFDLEGKTVLCYSRLLSFARLLGEEAVLAIINLLKKHIGPEGTLCFPCYTFSAYNNAVFNPENSKSSTGVLGECARKLPEFCRTVHPVYSHVCWGKNADELQTCQNQKTCFGKDSFFELFCKYDSAYLLFLGTNFSAQTLYHHYEQRFKAPGRFLKSFKGVIEENGKQYGINFDSYVKDLDFYKNKMNSFARFDALTEKLKLVTRHTFAADWIHGITEKNFRALFQACLEVDQEYFLCSTKEQWETYYLNNDFRLFLNQLDIEKVRKVKKNLMDEQGE
jgi:aminoglycoside N3'-acetyltransferase